VVVAGLVLAVVGCTGKGKEEAKGKGPNSRPVPVTAAKVVKKTVPFQLQAVGNVETLATIAVKSRVDGQIVKVGFKDGQDVKKGQLLFQIDPRPFETQLKQTEATLLKDKAQLAYAKGQEQRYADLLKKNFVSKEAYAQVQANMESSEGLMHADQASVENAKLQLSYTTIVAPINGRVGKIMATEGNLVKANDTNAMVVINQISPIYVSFAVPEQYGTEIRQRHDQGKLKVEALPRTTGAKPEEGWLAFVDNTVDTGTGTVKLRGEFTNKDRILWPGDFVEATLFLREDPDRIVVPSSALLNGPTGLYVYVIKPDMTVEKRIVVLDRATDGESVIAKGLKEGELVVTDGASRLTPKSKVQVKQARAAK
jgi:multidrug efflux system membrane fusion protein